MSLDRARAMLVAAADFGEGLVKAFAARVLAELDDGAPPPSLQPQGRRVPLTNAEKCRRYRSNKPRGDTNATLPGVSFDTAGDTNDTVADTTGGVAGVAATSGPRARTSDPDLSLSPSDLGVLEDSGDLEGGSGGGTDTADTDTAATPATPTPTPPRHRARKRPETHCPGAEETPEAVDRWCRGQRLPPASQVPEVGRMIRWHQMRGIPRASWLATWQNWQAKAADYPASTPRLNVAADTDTRTVLRDASAIVAANAAADAARAADEDQAQRARWARGRPHQAAPAAVGRTVATSPRPPARPPVDLEAERQRQLDAARDFDATGGKTR